MYKGNTKAQRNCNNIHSIFKKPKFCNCFPQKVGIK